MKFKATPREERKEIRRKSRLAWKRYLDAIKGPRRAALVKIVNRHFDPFGIEVVPHPCRVWKLRYKAGV